jgi:uncharacterized membrane protein YbhN (UPF0104 family)
VSGLTAVLGQAADGLSDPFGRLDPRFAALALALQAANLVLRAGAWRNVLAAAYPAERLPLVRLGAVYAAGVALNGFLPARGGEAAKIALARLQVRRSSVASIASAGSLLVVFDALLGGVVILVLWATGTLPGPPRPPAFVSDAAGQPFVVVGAAAGLLLLAWVAARRFARAFRALADDLRRGAVIVRTPRRYAREVLSLQVAAWGTRIGAAFFLLAAFGVPASVPVATLVVVAGGLSTVVPAGPGGAGAQQVLVVYALRSTVAAATAISFSIGMQVVVTATNALVGVVALMFLFGTLRPVAAVTAAARAGRRPAP